MPELARTSARGERTRRAILTAAERLFAERGFAEARLEDVAERVGIRRASIVYYFRDKRELYDAVLADVFEGLHARLAAVLERPAPLAERIPAAVSAWVDYVGERPALARLLLREVADAGREAEPALARHIEPFFALARRLLAESESGAQPFRALEPIQIASTLAGATVFFVAAMPALLPGLGFDPMQRDQLEAHRAELLRVTHRLLDLPPGLGGQGRRAGPKRRH